MATILIAGLSRDLEASLHRALVTQGHTVVVARDARRAWQALEEAHPELAILNPDLPGRDGIQFCADVRAASTGQNILILLLGHRNSQQDKLNGFAAGADEYVTVPFHMPELLVRIEALLRRSRQRRDRSVAGEVRRRHGSITLDLQTGELRRASRRVLLTPVETRLLNYLMTCAGRAVPAEELLQRVWKQAPGTADPTLVRVHVRHLRQKLTALCGTGGLLVTIPRFGYCLVQDNTA
jgi:DNA-binding response OmpR family regulator